MRKSITVRELYNKIGKSKNANINTIKRISPNSYINNDERIWRRKVDGPWRLLLCIDYDPDKIIDTGIKTTPGEARSGMYIRYAEKINELIKQYAAEYINENIAYAFEYIASRNRIDYSNKTVMIIGLSSSGSAVHPTNIYAVNRAIANDLPNCYRMSLRENYEGAAKSAALTAYNTANIPVYMQPMVSIYLCKNGTYQTIRSYHYFMRPGWVDKIYTAKWLRCLDIDFVLSIASMFPDSVITTDEGLEVFAGHELLRMESLFVGCTELKCVEHMNNFIVSDHLLGGDFIKSMFAGCTSLTSVELRGWTFILLSSDAVYADMFVVSGSTEGFMISPDKTYYFTCDQPIIDYVKQTAPGYRSATSRKILELVDGMEPVNGVYNIVCEM